MNKMNRQDYYRAVLLGVVIGMGLLSLLVLINPGEDVKPVEPDQKFEVVDNYKGCEVVRYTPDNSARYTYFLDCKDK
jgi:hypothetical protein